MRCLVLSDLHLDLLADRGAGFFLALDVACPVGEADTLVLAGDITSHRFMAQHYGEFARRFAHTICILGNHDHWGMEGDKALDHAHNVEEKLQDDGHDFYLLDNDSIEIQGVKFLGACGWFGPTGVTQDPRNLESWPDYRRIRGHSRNFIFDQHDKTTAFLAKNVKSDSVVLTHHLPAWPSVSVRFRQDPTNDFFLSDREPLIVERQPRLWIHGHTHDSKDYQIGATRVLCNPKGYEFSVAPENPRFNLALTVNL